MRTVTVKNQTSYVDIVVKKKSTQTVTVDESSAALVSGESTDTERKYRVDLSSIANSGGQKTFTLKASEDGKADVLYGVIVQVEKQREEEISRAQGAAVEQGCRAQQRYDIL